MSSMAATLLLLQQLNRSRRDRGEIQENRADTTRQSFANSPICAEESCCLQRWPSCRKFTCTKLVLTIMGTVILVLAGVSIASTLMTRYIDFDNRTLSLSSGDVTHIQDGFSSTFCKSLRLSTDTSFAFDAYLLKDEPEISYEITSTVNTETFTITGMNFRQWKFHLLEGTTVLLRTSTAECSSVIFYLIKELRDVDLLMAGDGEPFQNNVRIKSPCDAMIKYNIEESSDYYFVYENARNDDKTLNVSLSLERTKYKLRNVENECHSVGCYDDVCYDFSCVLAVPELTYLVLSIPEMSNSSLFSVAEIDLTCDPQILAYVIMFATLPLVGFAILLPLSFITVHIARRIGIRHVTPRRRPDHIVSDGIEESVITRGNILVPPMEIMLSPPPYDGHKPPPPYDEVVTIENTEQAVSPTTEPDNTSNKSETSLPENPPSYDESGRDFVVSLAAPT